MRVAFAYGKYAAGGKVFDLTSPEDSPSGFTGSEWSCLCYAREMRRRGHDVTLYLPAKRPFDVPPTLSWEGVRVRELSHLAQEHHDAVVAWNEPDLLRSCHPNTLRICNQQLNDFWYAAPGYDDAVDIYTSPSESHLIHLRDQTPSPHKWRVLPNGCDPTLYDGEKVPGRVVYASSPDRGLHQLLPLWPAVKERCPEAHLRIFYDLAGWFGMADLGEHQVAPRHIESRRRAIEVRALLVAGVDGVEVVGPVSRRRMVKELSEAMVLAYPCDPYVYTEGFSVTTMEACAAGCVPVVTDADALGEVYGGVCPMVRRRKAGVIECGEYVELVVQSLTDDVFRRKVRLRAAALAQEHSWERCGEKLDAILLR